MSNTTLGIFLPVIAVVKMHRVARLDTLNTRTGIPGVVAAARAKSNRFKRWSQLNAVAAFSIVLLHIVFRSM